MPVRQSRQRRLVPFFAVEWPGQSAVRRWLVYAGRWPYGAARPCFVTSWQGNNPQSAAYRTRNPIACSIWKTAKSCARPGRSKPFQPLRSSLGFQRLCQKAGGKLWIFQKGRFRAFVLLIGSFGSWSASYACGETWDGSFVGRARYPAVQS